MNRLISIVLIALAVWGGWKLVKYSLAYEAKKTDQKNAAKQTPARVFSPDQLPGLPSHLQASLDAAERDGAAAMGKWLKTYGRSVQDPRKAWIELDYCRMLARENPNEARRIFAAVKQRTPSTSPVWPRIQELKNSFE